MELFSIFVAVIIVFFLLSRMNNAVTSQNLQNSFISLGDMMGKSEKKIISVVGKPNSITNLGSMGSVYYWHSDKYQMSLSFQNGKCTGIVQENIIK